MKVKGGSVRVALVIVTVTVMMGNGVRVRGIESREYDRMLNTVRARGYNLFCNAIVTSDLQFDILSDKNNNTKSNSFTFFAPTDAALFALDMTQTASSYTDTLRFHVIPRRLSLPQLRLLPDGYTLPTLLPHRRLQLSHTTSSTSLSISGVHLAFPAIFYGRNVAVHGLAGILTLRSNNSPSPSPSPIRSLDLPFFSPRTSHNSPATQPVLAPFYDTNRPVSPPPIEAPEGEPDWTLYPPAASPSRYPHSEISLPPEEYPDADAPAPEGIRKCLNPDVGLEDSVMKCHAA